MEFLINFCKFSIVLSGRYSGALIMLSTSQMLYLLLKYTVATYRNFNDLSVPTAFNMTLLWPKFSEFSQN